MPVWPFAVAVALVKSTVPKSDSGSGVQLPEPSHSDGASAIHSALEVSGLGDETVFENDCPVVSSVSENEVLCRSHHAGRDVVARMDREVELDRRGGHELVPRVVLGPVAGAVPLGPDLLERR